MSETKKVIGYLNGKPVYRIAGGAPTPLEVMENRLTELRKEAEGFYNDRGALIDTAANEKRGFTEDEQTRYDELTKNLTAKRAEVKPVEDRVAELREEEKREKAAAEARKDGGQTGEQRTQVNEPDIYQRGGPNSYFRDLAKAQLFGDPNAAERLSRHSQSVKESRALGNTGAVGGSGGEFAPPAWLVDEYISLVRQGRVTADLFNQQPIPDGVSSVNLPAIATGTTTAIQSTQNSALSQTDLTTTYVQTGFATIGGKQVVSQQLLDQSAIPFDEVVTRDLAADYALRVGTQIYTGTGTGSGTTSVVNGLNNATIASGNAITYTDATPTVAEFYSKAAGALAGFLSTRIAPPTAWIMHPRRWFWLVAASDSNSRPLVVPQGNAFNPVATMENPTPQGLAGMFLGLPVYIDPHVPTNVGAGTNQDTVYLVKQDDLWLFESAPRAEVFRETYADSVGVLFRLYGYVGTILNRYAASIATINGTGLIAPTF